MIFLSHTYIDKPIVENIARPLAEAFGQEKVFYDSWSIQPGEGIIDKMNEALEKCKYFFFFVSKHSLQSNMVKLEWQNALYKSTKDQINIIPVKIDNSMMPTILAQTLYIDVFGQGLQTAIRQMIDVISGNNTYRLEHGFHNIRAYITLQTEDKLIIEFRAEVYMEPQSSYLILLNNSQEQISFKAVDEGMFNSGFGKTILDNGLETNAISISRSSATSPGFPFVVEITSTTKLDFMGVMRAVSSKRFESIPLINFSRADNP